MKLFKAKSSIPTSPTKYPPATFIKTEKGYFYIKGPGKRWRILSERVLHSWRPHRVVETSEAAVAEYRIVARLRFRNGSLIHNFADGKMYLIVDSKRCQIVSPDALTRIGAVSSEAITVSKDEIEMHDLGDPLT